MNGRELLIDITTDEVSTELLKDVDDAKLLMLEIVRKLNLNVVSLCIISLKMTMEKTMGLLVYYCCLKVI